MTNNKNSYINCGVSIQWTVTQSFEMAVLRVIQCPMMYNMEDIILSETKSGYPIIYNTWSDASFIFKNAHFQQGK